MSLFSLPPRWGRGSVAVLFKRQKLCGRDTSGRHVLNRVASQDGHGEKEHGKHDWHDLSVFYGVPPVTVVVRPCTG